MPRKPIGWRSAWTFSPPCWPIPHWPAGTDLGLAVQAYQKRAPPLIDWVAGLAARTGHRVPVRLVKGAYWDTEIKLAQVMGYEEYPVFTRKTATDVSWIACALRMLARRDVLRPAFATHNAHSLAVILEAAGDAATSRCSACTAWARRCTTAGRPRLSGAGLCAGGLARGSAGVSGAAPAGERRQHQLRASAGRSCGAGGRDHRRSGRAAARAGVDAVTRAFLCRPRCIPDRRNSAGLDLADPAMRAGSAGRRPRDPFPTPPGRERADPRESATRRTAAADRHLRRRDAPAEIDAALTASARGMAPMGRRRAAPRAPRCSTAPPI